jgi:hypothetical protein
VTVGWKATGHRSEELADFRRRDGRERQVSSNWAVWDMCAHRVCSVYRYDIGAQTKSKVPNTLTGKEQYFPSVTSTGTVYFAHSGDGCGRNVKLVEWVPGTTTALVSFRAARDAFSVTQTVARPRGKDVYYDRYRCRRADSDISRSACRRFRPPRKLVKSGADVPTCGEPGRMAGRRR